ncbi:MAG: AtpZ/AtpI family protein [Gemmataceae bacterium]
MLPSSTDRKELARYMALSQVGLEMVAPIGLGLILDHYLKWSPWGVISGSVLGLVGGIAHLIQLSSDRETRGASNPASPSTKAGKVPESK